jgi:3-hydroxyacyl-CoA dehydrogenase
LKILIKKVLHINQVNDITTTDQVVIIIIIIGKVTDKDIAKKISLISPATSLGELKDVDLVIEAVYENIDIKKTIFADLDKIVSKDTILATNTSALDIDVIASSTSSPSRFMSPLIIILLLSSLSKEL